MKDENTHTTVNSSPVYDWPVESKHENDDSDDDHFGDDTDFDQDNGKYQVCSYAIPHEKRFEWEFIDW